MKISEIFSKQSLYNTERANEAARVGADSSNAKKRGGAAEDSVTISAEARQFQQISGILAEDEALRKERVLAIKSQVESGKYLDTVSSEKVAQAIVSFYSNE